MLSRETELVQNAALGAVVHWRFTRGHCPKTADRRPVPMPLLFVVLPIIFNERTREQIERTQRRSGLRGFESRFLIGEAYKEDLLAVQTRVLGMRDLSLRSLRLSFASRLLHLDIQEACVWPTTYVKAQQTPGKVDRVIKSAEKFGAWCSDLTLFEIASILEVDF
jgi:hypothetical protein